MTIEEFMNFCRPYMCDKLSMVKIAPNEIWICYNSDGVMKFMKDKSETIIIVPYELKIFRNTLFSVDENGSATSSWIQDQRINENDYDTLRKKLIELNLKAKEIQTSIKLNVLKKDFE